MNIQFIQLRRLQKTGSKEKGVAAVENNLSAGNRQAHESGVGEGVWTRRQTSGAAIVGVDHDWQTDETGADLVGVECIGADGLQLAERVCEAPMG
mgnify:CR=1 FL=1